MPETGIQKLQKYQIFAEKAILQTKNSCHILTNSPLGMNVGLK